MTNVDRLKTIAALSQAIRQLTAHRYDLHKHQQMVSALQRALAASGINDLACNDNIKVVAESTHTTDLEWTEAEHTPVVRRIGVSLLLNDLDETKLGGAA
jgi:hypothetical protein